MDSLKAAITDCIFNDIHVCLKNNAPTGAVILIYCAIDAMSALSMPFNKRKVDRDDFIAWVEKYMKTDSTQPYQYQGVDLYGARCGIVHNYGVESNLSNKKQCKEIVYKHNCLEHFYDAIRHPELVVLGINLFIRDFYDAVIGFPFRYRKG